MNAVQYNGLIFLPPSCFQKSVIIVSNVYKEYKIKKAGSVFRKKKKVATKNISFCVKKGEDWNCFILTIPRELILCRVCYLSCDTKVESIFSLHKAHPVYGW